MQQWCPQLEGGRIKRDRGQLQHPNLLMQRDIGIATDEAQDAAVLHQHPFGRPGGAGGVDHIGQLLGSNRDVRRGLRLAGDLGPLLIEAE